MWHDFLKTTALTAGAILLVTFAAPSAHATPVEIELDPIGVQVQPPTSTPEYEHQLGDDEDYGGAIGASTYVAMQCGVGPNGSCSGNTNVVSVPEPGTLLMFATGLVLLTLSARQRRDRAKQ